MTSYDGAMTKPHLQIRCAGAAIAAVLALGSTPVFAQDASTPTVILPETVTSSAPSATLPAPQPVSPATSPTTPSANPVTQNSTPVTSAPRITLPDDTGGNVTTVTTPATSDSSVAPASTGEAEVMSTAAPMQNRSTAESTRSTGGSVTVPNTEPAPVASVEEASTDAPAGLGEIAPLAAEGDLAATPPVQSFAENSNSAPAPVDSEGLSSTALLLGLLAALGVVGAGVVALRRRSRSDAKTIPAIERPVVDQPPVATPSIAATGGTVAERSPSNEALVDIRTWAQPVQVGRTPASTAKLAPHSGAAVALPREMPQTYEERDALLKRMVDARPDRANPFRSRKARARRARLIMQSLGRKFETAEPRMDLSQYSGNWPALANRKHSYAA